MIGLENSDSYFSCRKIENGKKGDYVDSILQELFNSKEEMEFLNNENIDYCFIWFDFEGVYELFEKNAMKIIEKIEK